MRVHRWISWLLFLIAPFALAQTEPEVRKGIE